METHLVVLELLVVLVAEVQVETHLSSGALPTFYYVQGDVSVGFTKSDLIQELYHLPGDGGILVLDILFAQDVILAEFVHTEEFVYLLGIVESK